MMLNYRKCWIVAVSVALISSALASGWNVNVTISLGSVNNPITFLVPFNINGVTYAAPPANVTVGTPPSITFLTQASNPPVTIGDGTPYTTGTFDAAYSLAGKGLNRFTFIVSGFVWGRGQVNWQKTVTDATGNVVYSASGSFAGSGAGGTDGAFLLNLVVTLPATYTVLNVSESFQLTLNGAPAPGTDTASLLLVEQDWVPEPASWLVLGAGLGSLLVRRRRQR